MKKDEKLTNGKYLMTLSFGEVISRDTAQPLVDKFVRDLQVSSIRAEQASTYEATPDGTSVKLMLQVVPPTTKHLANHWAKTAPNGKCQIMSFFSPCPSASCANL